LHEKKKNGFHYYISVIKQNLVTHA